MNFAEDVEDLAGAEEEREAGLEDVGRFDFINLISFHGLDLFPAGPRADLLRLDFFPAPRGENHFGIPANDFFGRNPAFARDFSFLQFFKDIVSAEHPKELPHPPDPGNEGFVPLLEIDAETARVIARAAAGSAA